VMFSADGRRLYTTTGRASPAGSETRAWRLDSWESDHALALNRVSSSPASLVVAPDGTVAVTFTMNDVRLLDPATLAELATLTPPEPGLIIGINFSPDGNTLATAFTGTVHLWDLRRLREELAGAGLDSDTPASPKHH